MNKMNSFFTVLVACLLLNQAICVRAYNLSQDNLVRNKKNYYAMAIRSLAEDRNPSDSLQSSVYTAGFSQPCDASYDKLNNLTGKKAARKYHNAHYAHGGENGECENGEYQPTQYCAENNEAYGCEYVPTAIANTWVPTQIDCETAVSNTWIPTECNKETIAPAPTCIPVPTICEPTPAPIETCQDDVVIDECTEQITHNTGLPKSWAYESHHYAHHTGNNNGQGFLGY